ncbi:bifunctional phosphopantothenoylcysteine decarboxylase/phosphopantothenate--cysteine ligase CoaBC [Chloroflexota bacterium]
MLANKTIVLGISGGIAAYKAVEIASKLTQAGAKVHVVMTESATRFVAPLTFRSITGQQVVTDMFEPVSEWSVVHVALAEAADVVVIAPATANTIAKLTVGIADDMLGCTVLATKAPVIVAPSMNDNMFQNPVTQDNLAKLKARGFTIIEPGYGRLASSKIGKGRLAEIETIVGAIKQVLGSTVDLAGKRIVVTAGGTQEPIDPVRHIGNRSSGKMGYAIAKAARDRGATVTLITAPTSLPEQADVEVVHVRTASEMKGAVVKAMPQADALIMAAAVADYQPKIAAEAKIKKEAPSLTLELIRTTDILAEVKGNFLKVGFAAESEDIVENAKKKLEKKQLDLIVANDITDADSGFDADNNKVTLIDRKGNIDTLPLLTKREVADRILDKVTGHSARKQGSYIETKLQAGHIKRKHLVIPESCRRIFPEFETTFTLVTNAGDIETTTGLCRSGSSQALELRKGLSKWYKENPQLEDGDWVRISAIEPMKKYRLEILE